MRRAVLGQVMTAIEDRPVPSLQAFCTENVLFVKQWGAGHPVCDLLILWFFKVVEATISRGWGFKRILCGMVFDEDRGSSTAAEAVVRAAG